MTLPEVSIVGVGGAGFRPAVPELSTRELMFEAASRAYQDAGIDPRKEVDSFITTSEDFWEGWSITDEMVPDQIGGAGRTVCTIPGDAITGMGNAVMHIVSGIADVVVLEAHSKVGDVISKEAIEELGQEPTTMRPLEVSNDTLAALEMSQFLAESGLGHKECDRVVENSRKGAAKNPRASYLSSARAKAADKELISSPLRRIDKAHYSDAAVVLVLASRQWAKRKRRDGVGIAGLAWNSSLPWFDGGEAAIAGYARVSFERAVRQAGLGGLVDLDLIEVDDSYSFKALQHLLSMSEGPDQALAILRGRGPALNPSGGALAVGNLIEASAAHRLLEAVLQLRGQAEGRQVKGAAKALVQSWRGIPTGTGGVAILSAGE